MKLQKNIISGLNYWGWKDPRNSITFGLWREIFPNAKVIVIQRHGLDVALSLRTRRRKYLDLNKAKLDRLELLYRLLGKKGTFVDTARCHTLLEELKLWGLYSSRAEAIHLDPEVDSHFIRFEDYLQEPVEHINSLVSFLGLSSSRKAVNALCNRIDTSRAFGFKTSLNVSEFTLIELEQASEILAKHGYSF